MLAGSPGSVRLSFALQQRMRLRSLDDVFRAEYIAALACAAHGDFAEGIRALLIDKDKRPRWNPAVLDVATDAWVQKFFDEPWPEGQPHPLDDLGKQDASAGWRPRPRRGRAGGKARGIERFPLQASAAIAKATGDRTS